MTKQIVACVVVAVGLLTAGCGSDGLNPRQGCEQLVVALCKQVYACFTAAEIQSEGFPPTEPQCVSGLQMFLACAQQTTENTCDAGEKFQAGEAESCVNQVEDLECSQVRATGGEVDMAAPACAKVCVVP